MWLRAGPNVFLRSRIYVVFVSDELQELVYICEISLTKALNPQGRPVFAVGVGNSTFDQASVSVSSLFMSNFRWVLSFKLEY